MGTNVSVYSIGIYFSLLYVVKDVGTSNVWELTFPKCSIGIYCSYALCGEGCGNIQTYVGIYFSTL